VLSSYAIECGCIFDQSPGDMCRLERHKSLHSIVFQVDVCPFVSPYERCETNPNGVEHDGVNKCVKSGVKKCLKSGVKNGVKKCVASLEI
jgi:hypothetical protein